MHISKSKAEQSNKYSLSNCSSIDLDKKVAMSKALKMNDRELTESESNSLKQEIEDYRLECVNEIITYDPIFAIEDYTGLLNDLRDKGLEWNKEAIMIFTKDVYGTYILKRTLKLKTIGEKAFLEEIDNRR